MTIQCCVCHQIRDEEGWKPAAEFGTMRSDDMSHGYCPTCLKEAYKQLRASRYRALVGKPA